MIDINSLLPGFVGVHEEVLFVRASSRDSGLCEIGGRRVGPRCFLSFSFLFFFFARFLISIRVLLVTQIHLHVLTHTSQTLSQVQLSAMHAFVCPGGIIVSPLRAHIAGRRSWASEAPKNVFKRF
ncbi:hypothetical protein J3E68DRAFT_374297 [Trichoderma sp. SZMC 28012]